MELSSDDVAEYKALFRVGTVVSKCENYNLNIRINEVLYENVEVHYHCLPISAQESHPHDAQEMAGAFNIGDEIVAMCDETGYPKFVIGFPDGPKFCEPVIVLRKFVDDAWDYWYWVVSLNKGYHENPGVPSPMTPQIVQKTYTCVGGEEVELYYAWTPTLVQTGYGACGAACGLLTLDGVVCCDEGHNVSNTSDSWGECPCGGEWDGEKCHGEVSCGGAGEADVYYPGCGGSNSTTGNTQYDCEDGYDYAVAVGDLGEKLEVTRTKVGGTESYTICTVDSQVCGPYHHQKRCCDGYDEETGQCTGLWDPYYCGSWDCFSSFMCTGWSPGPPGEVWRWHVGQDPQATGYGGCIEITVTSKNGQGYITDSGTFSTVVTVGERELEFPGAWSLHESGVAVANDTSSRKGYASGACQSCEEAALGGSSYSHESVSHTELSYGTGGWHTVVTEDGRIAVLMPKLSASASAISQDGSVSGAISATTTVLLVLSEDEENEYTIAAAGSGAAVGMFSSRYDMNFKPHCDPIDVPLTVDVRGFHWYEERDWVFAAFNLDNDFHAALITNDDGREEVDMGLFESWVETNDLESYAMYLG